MLYKLKYWAANLLFPVKRLEERLQKLGEKNSELSTANQKLTELVSKPNSKIAKEARKLVVTDHAVLRYKQRFTTNEPDEIIRKRIYKGVVSHLFSLDSLSDGRYSFERNKEARVVNNTIVTVYPRRGSK